MSSAEPHQPMPANTVGAVATILRIIAGLTNERVLVLAVVFIAGFLIFSVVDAHPADKRQVFEYAAREAEFARVSAASEADKSRAYAANEAEKSRQHASREAEKSREFYAERELAKSKFEADEHSKYRTVISSISTEHSKWRDMLNPILRKLPAVGGEEAKTDPVIIVPVKIVNAYRDAPEIADVAYTDQKIEVKFVGNDYKCQKDGVYWYKAANDKHPTMYFACNPPDDCTLPITIVGTCKGAIRDGTKRADDVDFLLRIEECQVKQNQGNPP